MISFSCPGRGGNCNLGARAVFEMQGHLGTTAKLYIYSGASYLIPAFHLLIETADLDHRYKRLI